MHITTATAAAVSAMPRWRSRASTSPTGNSIRSLLAATRSMTQSSPTPTPQPTPQPGPTPTPLAGSTPAPEPTTAERVQKLSNAFAKAYDDNYGDCSTFMRNALRGMDVPKVPEV